MTAILEIVCHFNHIENIYKSSIIYVHINKSHNSEFNVNWMNNDVNGRKPHISYLQMSRHRNLFKFSVPCINIGSCKKK